MKTFHIARIGLGGLALLAGVTGAACASDADAVARGRALFQQQCVACHQMAPPKNGVGPSLQGLVGRHAAAAAGFSYSLALKSSDLSWTMERLDKFLSNPTAMVPGTRMVQRVANEQQRRDVIEFLATQ